MTTLTVMCTPCGGSGREPLGEITVKCHVCSGVGSVPAPGVATESLAPVVTLEMLAKHMRHLQQAVLVALATDPGPTLAEKREAYKRVLADFGIVEGQP